ncbi:MAG: radical SAM protein [Nitrososphaerota archaeon]
MVELVEERKLPEKSSSISKYTSFGVFKANGSFYSDMIFVPPEVIVDSYRISYPLIKSSRLTSKSRGGVGKELSNGWALNFAVGCTHGCIFCYVDSIHKRFGKHRYGSKIEGKWGDYFLIPNNIEEAIEKTPWYRWKNREVLLSSTHDPYLPQLAPITRIILEKALPAGVKFCIQTRSPLVIKDFDVLAKYAKNIRLQVSIATMNNSFSRLIEPRVAPPMARLNIIKKAKESGLETGVILAPIFPPTKMRPDVKEDLNEIMRQLALIKPDHIYGESLHIRGGNVRLIGQVLGEVLTDFKTFESEIKYLFKSKLREYGLKGTWWPEHRYFK